MIRSLALGIAALASLAAHPVSAASAAEADSSEYRTPAQRFIASILPPRIQLGLQAGVLASQLTASPEYRALITPVEARRDFRTSPSFGAEAVFRWSHGFSLAVAPRFESYGVRTREETVSFEGNPFPHTLEARTELSYMVLPVLFGMGWEGRRQHYRVQLGVYKASLDEGEVEWTVDGEPYEGKPMVEVNGDHSGWMFATEYGFRLGPGELTLGIEAQQALRSMMSGLEGEVKARGARAKLGYLWTLRGK